MNPLEQRLLYHAAQLELVALMHLRYLRPELSPAELAEAHERILETVMSDEAIAAAAEIVKHRLEIEDE